jgi:hypothetical protein
MDNEKTTDRESTVPEETRQALTKIAPKGEVSVFDTSKMDALYTLARKISSSNLIPEHYQNNPSNCFLAMWKSERMGMDFHSFMQVSYVLRGKFGYEAKFVIARLNTSGKFKGPIRWKSDGEIKYEKRKVSGVETNREKLFVSIDSTKSWTAYAVLKVGEEQIEQTFFLKTAIMNGWTDDPTSKWNTMTEEKGQYQSAVFLGRMYAPEVIMDMQTKEELEDIRDAEYIDATETGRDIFEKGEPVDTAAAPVLDPAMKVRAATTAHEPVAAVETPTEVQATPVEIESEYLPLTPEEASAEPPTNPAAFKMFLLQKFTAEIKELDVFLLTKKWLKMGETTADLSDSMLKNLRGQWDRFTTAYNSFKKSRGAA